MNSIVNRTEEIIKSEMIAPLTDSKPMQIRFYKNMNIRGEACYTSRPPLGIFSVTYCKFFLKLFSKKVLEKEVMQYSTNTTKPAVKSGERLLGRNIPAIVPNSAKKSVIRTKEPATNQNSPTGNPG